LEEIAVRFNPKIDLTDAQLETVCRLINLHLPGLAVWAYGSRMKGTARRNSDLDLVVFVDQASRAKISDLKESFEESNLPFEVDLHGWEELPREFRDQISAEKLDLLGNKE
jgi:predicted nucleotidyltransferase